MNQENSQGFLLLVMGIVLLIESVFYFLTYYENESLKGKVFRLEAELIKVPRQHLLVQIPNEIFYDEDFIKKLSLKCIKETHDN